MADRRVYEQYLEVATTGAGLVQVFEQYLEAVFLPPNGKIQVHDSYVEVVRPANLGAPVARTNSKIWDGVDLNAQRATNAGTPTQATDLATKAYVDANPGLPGPAGPAGPAGTTGAQGPAGPGIPSGGAVGQALVKNSATNYDGAWATVQSARAVGATITGAVAVAAGTAYVINLGASLGSVPITLPTAPPQGGVVSFIRADTNAFTSYPMITAGGGDTVGDTSPYNLTMRNALVTFTYIGTTWFPALSVSGGSGMGGATPSSLFAPTLMARDNQGRSQVQDPAAPQDIASKAYVDASRMPTGGSTGQVLNKKSATNYDTQWSFPTPIVFASATDRDTQWPAPPAGAMCWLNDVKCLYSYNGTAWRAQPAQEPLVDTTSTAQGDSTSTTPVVLTGSSVSFSVPASRKVRVDISGQLNVSVANDRPRLMGRIDTNNIALYTVTVPVVGGGGQANGGSMGVTIVSAGSHTADMTIHRASGTGTASVLTGAKLVVTDLGPG